MCDVSLFEIKGVYPPLGHIRPFKFKKSIYFLKNNVTDELLIYFYKQETYNRILLSLQWERWNLDPKILKVSIGILAFRAE